MTRPQVTIQHGAIVITDVGESGERPISIVLATLPLAIDLAKRLQHAIDTQADLLVAAGER